MRFIIEIISSMAWVSWLTFPYCLNSSLSNKSAVLLLYCLRSTIDVYSSDFGFGILFAFLGSFRTIKDNYTSAKEEENFYIEKVDF